jgi:hypothetical protein
LYKKAFDEMFQHRLSNGVVNAWAQRMDCTTLNDDCTTLNDDCTTLNDAHAAANRAIAEAESV